jgi:site-specific DNA-adenine methylase
MYQSDACKKADVICEPSAKVKVRDAHIEKYATQTAKPVVSYPGSKGRIAKQITGVLNQFKGITYYIEPFVGSGSVFFALDPKQTPHARLSDFDPRLANLYKDLKSGKMRSCKMYVNSKEKFKTAYTKSEKDGCALVNVTKSSFGGQIKPNAYADSKGRVIHNLKLDFASPEKRLKESHAEVSMGSYTEALKHIKNGTLLYMDPPYIGTEAVYQAGKSTFDGRKFMEDVAKTYKSAKKNKKKLHIALSHSYAPRLHSLIRASGIPMSEVKMCRVHVTRVMGQRTKLASAGKKEQEWLVVISPDAKKIECDSVPMPTVNQDRQFGKCIVSKEYARAICGGQGHGSTAKRASQRKRQFMKRVDLRVTLSKRK